MYALFENNEFIKLIPEIDAYNYNLEVKYMLYKIDSGNLKFHLDNYKFVIANSKILAYIPDENIAFDKIGLDPSIEIISAKLDEEEKKINMAKN